MLIDTRDFVKYYLPNLPCPAYNSVKKRSKLMKFVLIYLLAHGSRIFREVLKNPRKVGNRLLERTPTEPVHVAEEQKEQ